MTLISKRETKAPFLIKGKPCVVVPIMTSHRALRIFHDNHVYDIALSDTDYGIWTKSSNERRRLWIKKIMEETLLEAKSVKKNANFFDGYIA